MSSYVFTADALPEDPRLWPVLGNGHIGTVVHSSDVLMNGVYNGFGITSHRASIPSPVNVNLTSTEPAVELKRTYKLDIRQAIFEESHNAAEFRIVLRWWTHRIVLPLLVFEVHLMRNSSSEPMKIFLDIDQFKKSVDFCFETCPVKLANVRYGETLEAETMTSGKQSVHVLFDQIPSVLEVAVGEFTRKWTFLSSIHVYEQQAIEAYTEGMKLLQSDELESSHVRRWIETWNKGRIDLVGNETLARATTASLYSILSSVPLKQDCSWPFVGLSPCGLAWGDRETYFGHVFWDQETWMYPPILMLHSDIAHTLLMSRVRTMEAARQNANETGYDGLRYPWETAFTGCETTESEVCATREIHISADIAFAILQYWRAIGDDEKFVKTSFAQIILGIADFWISRVTYNDTRQLYDILYVQPPDEYAENVNNSAYTNSAASICLFVAARLARILGSEKQMIYDYYARHIYVPCEPTYHPEYCDYVLGTKVKQADVILMGFPLMWSMTEQLRFNDLKVYEQVTSIKGPAMSDSMFAIGWLEMKQYDLAITSFMKMFEHISPEFQVWTEEKQRKGATNFITGMGGYLQAILFGFGGLRLHDDRLDLDPVLPPNCTEMNITGLDYLGCSFNLAITTNDMIVTLIVQSPSRNLQITSGSESYPLHLNTAVKLQRGKATVTAVLDNVFNVVSVDSNTLHVQI